MTLQRLSSFFGEASGVNAFLAIAPVSSECVSVELRKRARLLHVNHQEPYVLSRLAASAALSSTLNASILFVGAREEARQYGAILSLSHEDTIGGAVAWRDNTPFAFGIDVVDIKRLAYVRRRFSHFGARWMPRCQPSSLDAADLAYVQMTYGDCIDPVDVVLAQHWGLRECCVKLVGIVGRSFPFECFRGPVALFPKHFEAHVIGSGGEALQSAGLHSNLFVSLWPHVLQLPSGEQRAFVTVVAACPRSQRR
ncbi:holo-[acyl-carrier-protein] synthase [Trypanosoma rangeli]|uniref:Holo-[acyl-carrier-protein] synthase n=1 Tax=Trypanosoma rangeli TaxID=5698 RepID=A0A3R7K1D8_TRYRA|nr:holo-[acyl-carrier-protein] synthase [Trypanosoma rangeli]RNE98869.1 holo-[acyl-carrier-protein] synthase [Trypanosoma rangeli]|eukprot:RNE98869.1 holo-[acyl-carrier-protein] synthase [Trypanosoma rangeli]